MKRGRRGLKKGAGKQSLAGLEDKAISSISSGGSREKASKKRAMTPGRRKREGDQRGGG